MFHFQKSIILTNNLELNINLHENSYFQIKLLKIGFMTDGKHGFDMLDHISLKLLVVRK